VTRRRVLEALTVALVLIGVALTTVVLASRSSRGRETAPEATLPPPPRPELAIPKPRELAYSGAVAHWSTVLRSVSARVAPHRRAPVVAQLERTTPEETTNLVLVLRTAVAGDGTVWSNVRLPILPNNTSAWVPRTTLGPTNIVDTHLVVDRATLQATLYRRGHAIFSAAVGIGTARSPTPAGEFYIRDRLKAFDDPFYGPVAFGTSARSAVLTDWPAGGYIGIHGTNRPSLLPGRVSHGCIRMRNDDILKLAKLLPIGTPLTIR
jgi:lipoprotein-anchoring transpeptidase ErfK/SrfK